MLHEGWGPRTGAWGGGKKCSKMRLGDPPHSPDHPLRKANKKSKNCANLVSYCGGGYSTIFATIYVQILGVFCFKSTLQRPLQNSNNKNDTRMSRAHKLVIQSHFRAHLGPYNRGVLLQKPTRLVEHKKCNLSCFSEI